MGHLPRALPAFDSFLEWLFSVVTNAAFAIIVAFLLVVLVAANVINIIVAVSIAGAWSVALIWIARSKSLKSLTILSRWVLVSAIGVVLGLVGSAFGDWALKQYNRQKVLEQPSTPPKPSIVSQNKPSIPPFGETIKSVTISLGDYGIQTSFDVGFLTEKPLKVIKLTKDDSITVRLSDGKLLISGSVWSPWGDVTPVRITDNNFDGETPPAWDRNHTDDVFEVVDDKGQPALQMIRMESNKIIIRGVFPAQYGKTYAYGPACTNCSKAPDDFKLIPIFKYPGWKFPGQYSNQGGEKVSPGIPGTISRNTAINLAP